MFQRRLLTLSGLVLLTILAIVLLPLVVIVTLLMSLTPKFRTAPQALTFIYGFLGHEWAGLARFLFVLVRYPKHEHMDRNRDIQFWWAQSLFNMGKRLYQLRIEVTGTEALAGNSALLLSRHSSMGDTVLPLLFSANSGARACAMCLSKNCVICPVWTLAVIACQTSLLIDPAPTRRRRSKR